VERAGAVNTAIVKVALSLLQRCKQEIEYRRGVSGGSIWRNAPKDSCTEGWGPEGQAR
jgi:hypothetical protein